MSTLFTLAVASLSFAQQPKHQQPHQQPKQQPKPQPAKPAERPPGQGLVYSPWSKFCGRDQNQPGAPEACLTIKEARLNTGQFVAGAAVIEPKGEQKKLLRITLPLGMQLKAGTRVLIDHGRAMQEHYVVCFPNGCMADFEIGPDVISTMKNSQTLMLQGMNLRGQVVSFPLPLADFAKANDGPPTPPPAQ